MTKQEIALQVFLKRMPSGHINAENMPGFVSAAQHAYEVAELFMAAARPKPVVVKMGQTTCKHGDPMPMTCPNCAAEPPGDDL